MNALLRELLKQTSRSFYLTLRVLPRAVGPQIGLAYLLARTTDTIADAALVPSAQRLAALQGLRERILGTRSTPLDFGELARSQAAPAERALLENVEAALAALRELLPADLQLTRAVLDTITSGQELDLMRFQSGRTSTPALTPALSPGERENTAEALANPTASMSSQSGNEKLLRESVGGRAEQPSKIIALQTDAELDDYTYRVAGCVGKFWTNMCTEHLYRLPEVDLACACSFEELGVRFGKGLQLVNILRDLPADLRKGRCYLPANKLAEVGLQPADLLSFTNEARLRPLYTRYLDLAESHLAAGWAYTNLIPFTWMSLRLACAWPILIGMKTLGRLRTADVLDPQQRIKITRPEVRRLILRSVLYYPWPSAWKKLVPSASY